MLKEAIIVYLLFVQVEALLRVSPVDTVCPDSTITFTCDGESATGPGSIIRWTATLQGTELVQFTFFPTSQPSYKHYHGLLWNASAISSPFRSTLSTITTTHLNGTVVECGGSGIQVQRIPIVVAQYPGLPTRLHVASIVNSTFSAALQLEWGPPSIDGGAEINYYTVMLIDSDSDYSLAQTVTNTTVTIPLVYNTNYIIHVTATNCAGSSSYATLESITIVNCSMPNNFAQGIAIKPFNSTTEGSVIFYSCDVGFFPNESQSAVCQSNGVWSEPINMNCTKYFEGRENITNLLCSNTGGSGTTEFLSITTQQLSGHGCECLPSSDLVETCCSHNGESDSDSMQSATFGMTFVIGLFVGSFLVGAFCGMIATSLLCWSVLSWTQKKRMNSSTSNSATLELSRNPAYETVSIRQ